MRNHRHGATLLTLLLLLVALPTFSRAQHAPRKPASDQQAPPARSVQNTDNPRGAQFAASGDFYTPYRRDAFRILKDTERRHFSGGPAVVLLQDRVVRLEADGRLACYYHTITRVLTRDAIAQYGEVSLPPQAEILELRTLKADGVVAEPEFTPQKATISMPALATGDAIEQEYVVRYPVADSHSKFVFGSFKAPILYSRLVFLSPANAARVTTSGRVPPVAIQQSANTIARLWEMNDIAQSSESSTPHDSLPAIQIVETTPDGRVR